MKTYFFVKNLFLSFRPAVSIFAGLLVHIGAKLSVNATNWYLVLIVSCITGLIMLQNDYFDRFYDAQNKGKRFVLDHSNVIYWSLTFGWCLILLLSFYFDLRIQLFLLSISLIGFCYSFLRKYFPLPLLTVILLSGLPVLIQSELSKLIISFFAIITITILGSEILKDAGDSRTDKGYKKTLFTETTLSVRSGRKLAALIFSTSIILFIYFTYSLSSQILVLSIIPITLFGVLIYRLIYSVANSYLEEKLLKFTMLSIIILLSF